MTLTEIMAELSAHVEQVEAENRELHAELKAIEDARRKHGQLADMPDVLTAQEIAAYLRGEALRGENRGWTLLTAGGVSLGWVKGSGGQLKNHYPKGLRRMG